MDCRHLVKGNLLNGEKDKTLVRSLTLFVKDIEDKMIIVAISALSLTKMCMSLIVND